MKPHCKLIKPFLMTTISVILTVTWLQKSRITQDEGLLDNLFAPKDAKVQCLNITKWEKDTTDAEKIQRLKEVDFINCDEDYLLLQSQLQRWPEKKPKAFIYFLVRFENLHTIVNSLALLDKHFNDKFQYPIMIFHEKEPSYNVSRLKIRSSTNSAVYFQAISFEVPDFLPRNLTQLACTWRIGYRHMCRFHAKLLYEQAIIRGFEFAWRLDDDSKILRPIHYDVFEFMRINNLQYGYALVNFDSSDCTVNLWESVEFYIRNTTTNTTFFKQWKKNEIFYNNFEISRLSLWRSADYQDYINYIDRLGGIYYYRWGDAPIKTIAVSMFVPKNQTHHFKDIGYEHQGFRN